ncbi:hypothetical protein LKL35_35315 [Streptomyces sp. ET3-23]|uniref:hypothetical protein n=1 Tax=Streptomyces sp. ET3-23 TaxID=2885643 RepID=UPI001D128365|nr:hypothetical protein [Streptomyces sp. ET3-23]MCC2280637.1 hypothetical protein [Streptomyces sp. ET3-23]
MRTVPLTTTTRGAVGPHRRRVLAGGAAALLTGGAAALLGGCAGSPDPEHDSAAERLRIRAGRDSAALLERYDATVAAHAGLAARLRPLRAEVARHTEAFGPRPAPSPSPSASASPSAPRVQVPADEEAALAALADAERRTADARTTALAGAPPELARLLASVAASGAVHAYLLGSGGAAT